MQRRQILFLALMPTLMLVAACKGGDKDANIKIVHTQKVVPQLHRTPAYDYTDSLAVGTHRWVYSIHREPCDSLKVITDEEGERYVDNFYQLTIVKDGQPFFAKRFTKESFASLLSADFRKNGILDGCRYSRYEDGKLYFSLCVSYPESDMSSPFILAVGPDGSHTIEADDLLDVGDLEDLDTLSMR
ncbi:MAG: DUF4738 domain-containing protein [Bacteroidaceae bacterium]|nr:DUF4738 domain-containing protein [Bacteroidaceae bacterium]